MRYRCVEHLTLQHTKPWIAQSMLDERWHPKGKGLRNTGRGHTQRVPCKREGPPLGVEAAPLLLLPECEGAHVA